MKELKNLDQKIGLLCPDIWVSLLINNFRVQVSKGSYSKNIGIFNGGMD